MVKQWLELWGEENTEYLAMFFNENPELHIRVNTTATTPDKLKAYFAKRDIILKPSAASSNMFYTAQTAEVLEILSLKVIFLFKILLRH